MGERARERREREMDLMENGDASAPAETAEAEVEEEAEAPVPVMEEPAMEETPAPEPLAPVVNKLREFEEQRRSELAQQQQEESAKIDELRETAKSWLEEQAEQREKTLSSRKSSNREKEELEAHVPSSNAWEEVSSLVDLSLGAGEAEDNNRMREVILRMKHKVATTA